MKKLISLLLALVMVLGLCACTTAEQVEQTLDHTPVEEEVEGTQATEPGFVIEKPEKEEISFDHINELEPVDGVYQIHSLVGVQNIANHLDADFEILCDIDLGGAVLEPIGTQAAPFTGEIKGNEFTISNFTIDAPTADGDLGFFGVNDGMVLQLQLADMTMVATDSAVRMGALAGTNTGTLQRCKATATLDASKAAANADCGGAVGVNTGKLRNTEVDTDIAYTASGAANIGGLVGSFTAGEVRDSDAMGKLEVTGENKNVGLFAGYAKDVQIERGVFLGEKNTVNGQLYNTYIGLTDNATATECLWRDNSAPELKSEVREIRQAAVQAMYEMGTVEWTVTETMPAECSPACNAGICHQALVPGMVYRGIPYKHNAGSLDRMLYCLDENHVMEDWVVEMGTVGGYPNYMGSDCYRACQLAWSTVANSMNSGNAMSTIMYPNDVNVIPVGQWSEKWPLEARLNDGYTTKITNYMTEQEIYEDYAQMHQGDMMVQILTKGAHAIMVAIDPVVVRDETGLIDPNESYILLHDQGSGYSACDEFYSTWGINAHNSFAHLYGEAFLPLTIQEMLEGENETPEARLEGGVDGKLGLMTGTIVSNFYVDSVTMVITDDAGNEVYNKKMFARIDKITDYDSVSMFERNLVNEFDLANFTYDIQNLHLDAQQAYHCTITANLHTGDHFVVKDYTF